MNKGDFLNLSDLDKLRYVLNQSLKEHKQHLSNPYWKGSYNMILDVLKAIDKIETTKSPGE